MNLGAGKAVLIDDGRWQHREARLLAFADLVERLSGRYVTAADVGTSPADMDVIGTRARWVAGRSPARGVGETRRLRQHGLSWRDRRSGSLSSRPEFA